MNHGIPPTPRRRPTAPRARPARTLTAPRALPLAAGAALALALVAPPARAQGRAPRPPEQLVVELPLVEVPQTFQPSAHFPTWQQAIDVRMGLLESSHWGIHESSRRLPRGANYAVELSATFLLDGLTTLLTLPGNMGWAHEEGHRAVLAQNGIESLNGYNDVGRDWPGGVVPVYGISDEQLADLKLRRPADQVRLEAAGVETEIAMDQRLERDTFLYDRPAYQNIFMLLLSRGLTQAYMRLSLDPGFNNVELLRQSEGSDVFLRDFGGSDFTGWVYDLFRPDEPYAARGPHPSGQGIRRARFPGDLTPAETSYLNLQANLQLVFAFLDPFVFGIGSFTSPDPWDHRPLRWNVTLAWQMAPFGFGVDANVYLAHNVRRVVATVHSYFNQVSYFPGLSLALLRYPVSLGPMRAAVSAYAGFWLQPRALRFAESMHDPGGYLRLDAAVPLFYGLEAYVDVLGKTRGWLPTHPSLDASVDVALGVRVVL